LEAGGAVARTTSPVAHHKAGSLVGRPAPPPIAISAWFDLDHISDVDHAMVVVAAAAGYGLHDHHAHVCHLWILISPQ